MYLHFDDLYTKADSPAISLDSLAPEYSDATVLGGIRELSARRNQSVCRECCIFEPDNIEKHVEMFEKYLALLNQFILATNTKNWSLELGSNTTKNSIPSSVSFRWASPLTSLRSSSSCTPLSNLLLEYAMALCFYAAALQENAWRVLKTTINDVGNSGGGDRNDGKDEREEDTATLTAAAALLRKSAGVYAYIKNTLLPEIEKKEALPSSSSSSSSSLLLPLELDSIAVEVLEIMALAQAQGVAAERAERKGSSPTVIAAVHRGAVDLYETAASKLKSLSESTHPSPPPSERFRMWLALSAEIHAIKALRAQAGMCRHEGELGHASACLKDAILRIQRCLNVVATAKEETEWRSPFLSELKVLESIHAAYEKERVVVYMQGVSSMSVVPPPPSGKVIIAPAAVDFLESSGGAVGGKITEHYFI